MNDDTICFIIGFFLMLTGLILAISYKNDYNAFFTLCFGFFGGMFLFASIYVDYERKVIK